MSSGLNYFVFNGSEYTDFPTTVKPHRTSRFVLYWARLASTWYDRKTQWGFPAYFNTTLIKHANNTTKFSLVKFKFSL